jgi:hypothetical protein
MTEGLSKIHLQEDWSPRWEVPVDTSVHQGDKSARMVDYVALQDKQHTKISGA